MTMGRAQRYVTPEKALRILTYLDTVERKIKRKWAGYFADLKRFEQLKEKTLGPSYANRGIRFICPVCNKPHYQLLKAYADGIRSYDELRGGTAVMCDLCRKRIIEKTLQTSIETVIKTQTGVKNCKPMLHAVGHLSDTPMKTYYHYTTDQYLVNVVIEERKR